MTTFTCFFVFLKERKACFGRVRSHQEMRMLYVFGYTEIKEVLNGIRKILIPLNLRHMESHQDCLREGVPNYQMLLNG